MRSFNRRIPLSNCLVFTLLACGQSPISAATPQSTVGGAQVSLSQLYAAIEASTAARPAYIDALKAKTYGQVAKELLPQITNDAISLGGVTFRGLADRLVAKMETFSQLDAAFPNIGAAWQAMGFMPSADVTEAELAADLGHMAGKTPEGLSLDVLNISPGAWGIYGTIGCFAAAGIVFILVHACTMQRVASNGSSGGSGGDIEMGVGAGVGAAEQCDARCPRGTVQVDMPNGDTMLATPIGSSSANLPAGSAASLQAAAMSSSASN